ncbi:MAG: hypothetical protein ACK4M6_12955 [Hyphomonas sp.]
MTDTPKKTEQEERQARRAEALRANLRRRKAAARKDGASAPPKPGDSGG